MAKPGDLEWQLLRYWEPDADLALSELDQLENSGKVLRCQQLDAQGEPPALCV